MANDKSKNKAATVYIPWTLWSEIVDYNKSEGNAGFGDSKMVVSILQKWYNARIEARVSWNKETERRKGERRKLG
jgi:hypothetical protein